MGSASPLMLQLNGSGVTLKPAFVRREQSSDGDFDGVWIPITGCSPPRDASSAQFIWELFPGAGNMN